MHILKTSLAATLVASFALAAPAFAAPARVSDSDLMHASRCLGLAKAANLGAVDATALAAFVKTQRMGRDPLVRDRSDAQEQSAKNMAGKAKDDLKASLIAERDGACKALIENPTGA